MSTKLKVKTRVEVEVEVGRAVGLSFTYMCYTCIRYNKLGLKLYAKFGPELGLGHDFFNMLLWTHGGGLMTTWVWKGQM